MGQSSSSPFSIEVLSASSLAQLVVNMRAGDVADFAMGNWTYALIDTGNAGTSLAYSNKGYWDPYDRIAYHFGSGHNPLRGVHMRYIDSANRWEDYTPPGVPPVQGAKHSYEQIAFQPRPGRKGILYHYKKYTPVVERLDLETGRWDRIADIPRSNFQVAAGLEWFPELFGGAGGLIHVDGDWGVAAWNSQNDRWSSVGKFGMGPYHNFATYLPDQQVVFFGGGNDSTDVYEIDANLNVSKKSNSPYKIGVDRKGIFFAQPGKVPVLFAYDNNIWAYSYAGDTWTRDGTHDIYTGAQGNWVVGISVEDYGCAIFLIEKNPPRSKVYKFRDL